MRIPRYIAWLTALVLPLTLAACASQSHSDMTHAVVRPAVAATATPARPLVAEVPPVPVPSADPDVAGLPVLSYESVVPALDATPSVNPEIDASAAFTLSSNAAVYAKPTADAKAVAVLPKELGWLDQATQVIVVQRYHGWVMVMLPGRKTLPSAVAGSPGSTSGWIAADELVPEHALPSKIVISVAKQTLEIVSTSTGAVEHEWPVSTGADGMPSPTGTTFIEARYSDPQNQAGEGVINLLSIHITEADSVYGDAAGLVALHAQPAAGTMDRSHGCIRLDDSATEAYVSSLPLGTVVEIE